MERQEVVALDKVVEARLEMINKVVCDYLQLEELNETYLKRITIEEFKDGDFGIIYGFKPLGIVKCKLEGSFYKLDFIPAEKVVKK